MDLLADTATHTRTDWRRPDRDSLSSLLERAEQALAEGNLEAGRALVQNARARLIVRGRAL